MTMIYTTDGMLYTPVRFNDLAAMNRADAKVEIRFWEFSGVSEDAARQPCHWRLDQLLQHPATFTSQVFRGMKTPEDAFALAA